MEVLLGIAVLALLVWGAKSAIEAVEYASISSADTDRLDRQLAEFQKRLRKRKDALLNDQDLIRRVQLHAGQLWPTPDFLDFDQKLRNQSIGRCCSEARTVARHVDRTTTFLNPTILEAEYPELEDGVLPTYVVRGPGEQICIDAILATWPPPIQEGQSDAQPK